MEHINEQLKKKIMRRVYITFFLKKVFNPVAVKLYTLTVFLGVSVSFVSFGSVLANMPRVTDIVALYNFSTSAFFNTEFAVQFLSTGALLAIFLLMKDIIKIYFIPSFSRA